MRNFGISQIGEFDRKFDLSNTRVTTEQVISVIALVERECNDSDLIKRILGVNGETKS